MLKKIYSYRVQFSRLIKFKIIFVNRFPVNLQDDPAVRGLPAERAQHVQPGQRGRLRHVQEVEGLKGEGQGVRKHHQVSEFG